jgi:hypothetical protein
MATACTAFAPTGAVLDDESVSFGAHAAAPDRSAANRTLQLLLAPPPEADIAVLLVMKRLVRTVYAIRAVHAAPSGTPPFAPRLRLG